MVEHESSGLIDTERIRHFYDRYVSRYGMSAGWSSLETAYRVYAAASGSAHQKWDTFDSVLDVGSGQGHLVGYLQQERGFTGRYTGLELLPDFISGAIQLYGDLPGVEFIRGEFLAHDFGEERFDWVFSLGSLAVVQDNAEAHDQAVLEKMVRLARVGITVYVNDVHRMKPGRLQEVEDLAAHDVTAFQAKLERHCDQVDMLRPFESQHVIFHGAGLRRS